MSEVNVESIVINCIRTLSMDAVQKANSGHPGTPMSLAPVTFKLWDSFIKHNPKNPSWPNRDRFILSAGHASMLIYSILHICRYDVSLDDIKNFRQLHAKCAGHPEFGLIRGVETTTGPLGQGASTSVGMAIAEKWMANYFNRPEFEIINYNIFSLLRDGDMMEGITSEAASIAGHLGLGNIVWIYDNNKITIEGNTDLAFSEDVETRFESYDWHTQHINDANDISQLGSSIKEAIKEKNKPSLIVMDSHIAFGSPNMQDNHEAHGAPLGEEEIRLTKKFYGLDPNKKFYVPKEVKKYGDSVVKKGMELETEWNQLFDSYSGQYPELSKQFELIQKGKLPENWDRDLPKFEADVKGTATRSANNKILNEVGKNIPWLLGGAADVGSSTKTYLSNTTSFAKNNYSGRNFHFGIRENAMAAISNGMALCNLRPYVSTYFVFSDYLKASLRLSSLMKLPVIYIFTHDSIGLGEDGPTHQPIEHLPSLRALPNIDVFRPADANELSVLWKHIMRVSDRPKALILTRQNVPIIDREKYASADESLKGAYVIADSGEEPEIILIATGSEVYLCIEVHEKLMQKGIKSRVVSMPCWAIFDSQSDEYKEKVLPSSVKCRLSVEAGSTFGWERYVGSNGLGKAYGIDRFGESAPYVDLMKAFGFTVDNLFAEAKAILKKRS